MANNAIIFGDSYSTFENYVPDRYAVYYSEKDSCGSDVNRVEQTWWYQVMAEAGFNLILNNSWSGSTIGYTGYNNSDCSSSSSFIYRFNKLVEQGFFEKNRIDTAFVFGGTNDSWADAPLGIQKYDNWETKDLYCVLPAIAYFLKIVRERLPQADIYCLINTELKPEISDEMKKVCQMNDIIVISFDAIDKVNDHPTVKGMLDIKNRVLDVLNRK